MRNLLILSTIAASAFAGDAPEPMIPHTFSVKSFYRYHKESGYNYKTFGGGIEYSLHPDEGFGFKLSTITDVKNHSALIESEQQAYYKFVVHDNHSLYPVLSTRFSSHQIDHDEIREEMVHLVKDVFINKYTAFGGIGWEIVPDSSFRFRIEGLLFRDLHNALLVQENNKFWGKSYSNPSGYKAKVGFLSTLGGNFFLDMEGFYTQTFEKCYKEMGGELSVKWGF